MLFFSRLVDPTTTTNVPPTGFGLVWEFEIKIQNKTAIKTNKKNLRRHTDDKNRKITRDGSTRE